METKLQKCQLHCRVMFIVNKVHLSTKRNISQSLLLKQTGENYETCLTQLEPVFHLNPST